MKEWFRSSKDVEEMKMRKAALNEFLSDDDYFKNTDQNNLEDFKNVIVEKVNKSIRLSEKSIEIVQKLATKENRNFSNMLETLIIRYYKKQILKESEILEKLQESTEVIKWYMENSTSEQPEPFFNIGVNQIEQNEQLIKQATNL